MFFIQKSNKLNLIQKIVSFLFVSLPILLISGPFLSDLAISLIAIYFFFNFKKIKIDFTNNFVRIFFLFYFVILLNSFNFDYSYHSIKSFLFYFRFFLFLIVMNYLILLENKIIQDLYKIILISIFVVIIAGIYEFIQIRIEYFQDLQRITDDNELRNLKNSVQQRIGGLFGEEKIMGGFLMKIFPFFLFSYFFIFNKKKITFYNYFFITFITFAVTIGIVISGDRAPLVLFFFQLFLVFLLIKKLRILFSILGVSLFIIMSSIVLNDPIIKDRVINVTLDNIKGEYNNNEYTLISKAYEGHFNAAIIIFKKYPVLGSGIKGFRNQCYNLTNEDKNGKEIWCTTHPHNIFFQIISETGVFGLIIYLYLFYNILKQLYLITQNKIQFKNKNKLISNQICLINFLVILWPLTTGGSIFNNYNSIFYYLAITLYLVSNNIEKKFN